MKKLLVAILVTAVMALAATGSEDKNWAVGGWLQAGNPGEHAGIDIENRLGRDITLDIYLHFCFYTHENALGGYVGYYWNYYLNVPKELGRMGFYVGPTGGLGWWNNDYGHNWNNDETGLAIRLGVVGGYQWEFPVVPLQLYLELSPVGEVHFIWKDENDNEDDYEDEETTWELPAVYFRIGLRFWF